MKSIFHFPPTIAKNANVLWFVWYEGEDRITNIMSCVPSSPHHTITIYYSIIITTSTSIQLITSRFHHVSNRRCGRRLPSIYCTIFSSWTESGWCGGGKMMVYEREKRPWWSSPDHQQQQQQHQMMALAAGGRSVSEEIILSSSHPCVGMWKYEVQVPRCIKKSPDLFCDCSVFEGQLQDHQGWEQHSTRHPVCQG